jgi:hypothetical protein
LISQKKLGIVQAFKVYGAKLANFRWAVSAIAADGSLVVSCWETHFRTVNKSLQYEDTLSRWSADNTPGSDLMKTHLEQAQRESLGVRLVIAHWADGPARIASHFHVRPDLVGRVANFDGDRFVISFKTAA